MPDKRARRHFSQLSEFERGLIIGIKLQAGRRAVLLARWIVRSAVRNCWEQWTREGTTRGKPGLERPEDHKERGSKNRAASIGGPHSDSFNDTSRRMRSNCSTNKFQTPCRNKS
ncbi:uncharacterized protein TNCV_2820921 [Trichonephila clavipes]|nr:uncharacterized protein TNCV_2820921 [Trichonephila clavipes]